jgi:hypothetical protein
LGPSLSSDLQNKKSNFFQGQISIEKDPFWKEDSEEDSEETEFPDREHLDPEHLDSEPLDPEPLDPVRPDYAVDSESAVSWRKNLDSIDFFVVNNPT